MDGNNLEGIVLKCNKVAMDFLQYDNFKESLNLLKRAEDMLNNEQEIPDRFKLLGITLNNFGCYYKRRKQYNVALEYLKNALKVELNIENDSISIASTHLNISAIYSAIKKHNQAFSHAKMALKLLEQNPPAEPTKSYATSLVISYYNAGTELEHLGKMPEAVQYLQSGLAIAERELGHNHSLTVNIENALHSLNKRFNHVQGFVNSRQEKRRNKRVSPHRVRKNVIEPVKMPGDGSTERVHFRGSAPPARNTDRIPETLDKIKLIASKLN